LLHITKVNPRSKSELPAAMSALHARGLAMPAPSCRLLEKFQGNARTFLKTGRKEQGRRSRTGTGAVPVTISERANHVLPKYRATPPHL